jgi:LacI family transcriptional regulator
MKPNIYEVAKQAGVSIATVSKVINNTGRISKATREKVLKVIEELQYHPSVVASALTGKHTYTIGLLVPDLANPFFAEIARSIEDRGHELGYNLIICNTDYNPVKEEKYIVLLKRKKVDAIICASGFEDPSLIIQLTKEKFPIALVARDLPIIDVNIVAMNDFMAGFKATSYLIELGHKHIGIITRDVQSNRERYRGYLKALQDHGLEPPMEVEYVKSTSVESGKLMAGKYLDLPDRPTALFACNDLLAIGAINAAKERSLNVPRDISIVGCDNTHVATIVDPPLTTIIQPIESLGRKVIEVVVDQIKNPDQDKVQLLLVPQLAIRDTTAPPNKKPLILTE